MYMSNEQIHTILLITYEAYNYRSCARHVGLPNHETKKNMKISKRGREKCSTTTIS